MERYTEDALMSDMILCLRELDSRAQPNTCRVLAKLATDYTKQLADAQATVEALQRERKQAEQKHLQDVAYMRSQYDSIVAMKDEVQAAFDAEREKAARQGRYAVDFFDEIQRMKKAWREERARFESDLVKAETERDKLQALVRALPEMVGAITVEQISQTGTNWALFDAGGWIATVDGKSVAKALQSLLQYRAALDATTPAVCPDCDGDGAVDSGGTDPNGNPLMRWCGCREKGGNGE